MFAGTNDPASDAGVHARGVVSQRDDGRESTLGGGVDDNAYNGRMGFLSLHAGRYGRQRVRPEAAVHVVGGSGGLRPLASPEHPSMMLVVWSARGRDHEFHRRGRIADIAS